MNKLLFLITATGILLSCNKSNNLDEIPNKLHGKWQMVGYGAFLPSLPELNENDITWTFDIPANLLTIVNNVELKYPFILPTGSYHIDVSDETMTIKGVEYDYILKNDNLTVSHHPELDGPMMGFVKK